MKKAFSLAFFVIGLIALATLLVLNSPSERRGGTFSQMIQEESPVPSQKVVTPLKESAKKEEGASPAQKSVPETQNESLSKKFLNSQLPMEERLDAWLKLNQEKPAPPEVLTAIAVAPNPFENQKKEPHSVTELHFRREEGFRIMALQGLERAALKNPSSLKWIETVAREASSPAVRKIAQKIKEFAHQGRSYSDMASQAIMNLEIPQ